MKGTCSIDGASVRGAKSRDEIRAWWKNHFESKHPLREDGVCKIEE